MSSSGFAGCRPCYAALQGWRILAVRTDVDGTMEECGGGNLFDAIRREIAEEYAQPHEKRWIVGFSGGKDSTVVAHLVVEHLLSIPRSTRTRPVHIVANDTLVESPLVIGHVRERLAEISGASAAFGLPIVVATTTPDVEQTFWINLIGRGYPSPNRSFRWCTDRMKIQPTSQYVRSQVSVSGEVILLLGVRRNESRIGRPVRQRRAPQPSQRSQGLPRIQADRGARCGRSLGISGDERTSLGR